MGYDLPAAIGAAIAAPEETVVCLAGDGSIMMNLQELATIAHHGMRILIFVLCNDGYLSIKQTQRNFFGRENGASSKSGLSYPDFKLIGDAFGIKSGKLNKECWKGQLKDLINQRGPIICEVPLDLIQEFEPRLKSRVENGKITTPELDDMFPLLEKSVLNNVRESAKSI
jgi:acetolactate synthase-1/2/3 large subunit